MSDRRFRELQRIFSESGSSDAGQQLIQEAVRIGRVNPTIRDFIEILTEGEFASRFIERNPNFPVPIIIEFTGLVLREAFKVMFDHPVFMFDDCTKDWDQDVVSNLKVDLENLIGYLLNRAELMAGADVVSLEPHDSDTMFQISRLTESYEYIRQQQEIPRVAPYRSGDFLLTRDPNWNPNSCWRMLRQFEATINMFLDRGYPVSSQIREQYPSEFTALLASDPVIAHYSESGEHSMQYPIGHILIVESYNVFGCLYEDPPWQGPPAVGAPKEDRTTYLTQYRAAQDAGAAALNNAVLPDLINFIATYLCS